MISKELESLEARLLGYGRERVWNTLEVASGTAMYLRSLQKHPAVVELRAAHYSTETLVAAGKRADDDYEATALLLLLSERDLDAYGSLAMYYLTHLTGRWWWTRKVLDRGISTHPPNLMRAIKAAEAETPEDAADVIYTEVDSLLQAGEYDAVDAVLRAVEVKQFSVQVLLAFVSICSAAYQHLPYWHDFMVQVRTHLADKEPERVVALLEGFPDGTSRAEYETTKVLKERDQAREIVHQLASILIGPGVTLDKFDKEVLTSALISLQCWDRTGR